MMNKYSIGGLIVLVVIISVAIVFTRRDNPITQDNTSLTRRPSLEPSPSPTIVFHPLSIEYMKTQEYPGSALKQEEILSPGSNYTRQIVSYQSEGLTIYAYLTIPIGEKPIYGWPVVVFNHGAIPPKEYRSTERYIAYQDAFARAGYIVFRSDYRGHGTSEGEARGGYGRPDYTIDVLNGLASVEQLPEADPNRIGFWGHSMGGYISLRALILRPDIKAAVIWAGVVAPYSDLIYNWRRTTPNPSATPGWRQQFIEQYGRPEDNPTFWNGISANSYLSDITSPIQLHHGTGDTTVPVAFSQNLNQALKDAGKTVEYYEYAEDDHDISTNFTQAMQRSVEFMDRYVKEATPSAKITVQP